ncbi:MAG TPA: uracil-DNA glycosylase [Pyrinomonadaceae bacterium]|nr:uracil-DNA glycosylase [Pyrinomonadaceae bacterium]
MTAQTPSDQLLDLVTQTKKRLRHLEVLGIESVRAAEHSPERPSVVAAPPAAATKPRGVSATAMPPVTAPTVTQSAPSPPTGSSLFGDLAPQPERLAASAETFQEIWRDVGDCTRCPLHQERTNIVHTNGNQKARLMFVGEAPGADEDAQAKPFVGRAGQLLTKIIEAIGLKREEVLIGNVNRCRPPGNRQPTPEEASMCKPFLLREIAVCQPEVIVVLGNTAMQNLLGTRVGITRLRGHFQDYKGIKVMPTFHPAYLLRDPSKKRETWEDLKKVRDYLDNTAKRS